MKSTLWQNGFRDFATPPQKVGEWQSFPLRVDPSQRIPAPELGLLSAGEIVLCLQQKVNPADY